MGSITRLGRRAAAFGAAALLIVACTPDTSSSDADPDEAAIPNGTFAIPAERLTPFCEAMIELSDRLETDPPADVEALIIETYVEIEDEVPPEIAPDFAAVLADLQGGPVPTTEPEPVPSTTADPSGAVPAEGDDPSDEGYLPSEDPTARLSAYVDYTCGGSLNNPGPPATQPFDDIAPPNTESRPTRSGWIVLSVQSGEPLEQLVADAHAWLASLVARHPPPQPARIQQWRLLEAPLENVIDRGEQQLVIAHRLLFEDPAP